MPNPGANAMPTTESATIVMIMEKGGKRMVAGFSNSREISADQLLFLAMNFLIL